MFAQTHRNDKVVINFSVSDDDICRQERVTLAFTQEYEDWAMACGTHILDNTVVYAMVTYWEDGTADFDTIQYDGTERETKGLAVDMEDIIESLLEEMLVAYFQ